MEKNAYRQRSRQAGSCRVRPEEWRFSLVDHPREHGWSILNFDYKARIRPREEVDQIKGANPMEVLIGIFTSAPLQKKKDKPLKINVHAQVFWGKQTKTHIPGHTISEICKNPRRGDIELSWPIWKRENVKKRFQTIFQKSQSLSVIHKEFTKSLPKTKLKKKTHIMKISDFRSAVYLCLKMSFQIQHPNPEFQSRESSRIGSISVHIRVFPITKTVDSVSLKKVKINKRSCLSRGEKKLSRIYRKLNTNFFLGDTNRGVVHTTRQRFSMTLFSAEVIIITFVGYTQMQFF